MEPFNELVMISTLAISVAICCTLFKNKRIKRRKVWMHPWRHHRLTHGPANFIMPELIRSNDYFHYNNFIRMNDVQFNQLLQMITPRIERKNTNFRRCISAKERLVLTLRYLATGKSNFFITR